MLWLVLLRAKRIRRDPVRSAEERGLALGISAATAGIVVHSIFVNSLLYPLLMVPLWTLWGMTGVLSQRPQRGEAGNEPAGREPSAPLLVALQGAS
jgi:hypothetical protein